MRLVSRIIVVSALFAGGLEAQTPIPLTQLLGNVPFVLKDSTAAGNGASLMFETPEGNELWADCRSDSTVDQFIARPAATQTDASVKNAYVGVIVANAFGQDSKVSAWFAEACKKRMDRSGLERKDDIQGWSLALAFQKGAVSRFIARMEREK